MYKVIAKKYLNLEYLDITKLNDDGSTISIPTDPDNTDYQAFLLWKSEGNEPLPAENT